MFLTGSGAKMEHLAADPVQSRERGVDMSKSRDRGATRSGAAAVVRLRDRIDRGETGDKAAFPDPAAAPLGTDAEAGGRPPTTAEVRTADTGRQMRAAGDETSRPPRRSETSRNAPAMIILIVVAIAALALAVLAI